MLWKMIKIEKISFAATKIQNKFSICIFAINNKALWKIIYFIKQKSHINRKDLFKREALNNHALFAVAYIEFLDYFMLAFTLSAFDFVDFLKFQFKKPRKTLRKVEKIVKLDFFWIKVFFQHFKRFSFKELAVVGTKLKKNSEENDKKSIKLSKTSPHVPVQALFSKNKI